MQKGSYREPTWIFCDKGYLTKSEWHFYLLVDVSLSQRGCGLVFVLWCEIKTLDSYICSDLATPTPKSIRCFISWKEKGVWPGPSKSKRLIKEFQRAERPPIFPYSTALLQTKRHRARWRDGRREGGRERECLTEIESQRERQDIH